MNGLKAQKPLAQGKRSDTLGDAFVSVAYALKGKSIKIPLRSPWVRLCLCFCSFRAQ